MYPRYLGIAAIAIGFASPYILYMIFPSFICAGAVSNIFFWLGFLIILRPKNYSPIFGEYSKWACYAIFVNIVFSTVFYLLFYLRTRNITGIEIETKVGRLMNPTIQIIDKIFPVKVMHNSDGTITAYYSYLRSLVGQFSNLVFYSLTGIVVKILIEKITSVSTRRQGPCRS